MSQGRLLCAERSLNTQ